MKTETKEIKTPWHEMTEGEKHSWREKCKEAKMSLGRAEAQIREGADAVPLLRGALDAARDLWRPQRPCDNELSELLIRISILAPAAGEDEAAMLCEGALEIADRVGCADCRIGIICDIVKFSVEATPDPESRIRLGKRLIARVEELETRDVERKCEESLKEADKECRQIRVNAEFDCEKIRKKAEDKCASITKCNDSRVFYAREASLIMLGRIRDKVSHLEAFATRAGEFQRPDFGKKPTPQPAEGLKMKRGDKI